MVRAWDARARTGSAGAIQALQLHPTEPVVVSVGLDRFVRAYDVNTRAVVKRVRWFHRRPWAGRAL